VNVVTFEAFFMRGKVKNRANVEGGECEGLEGRVGVGVEEFQTGKAWSYFHLTFC
jgi:hypothetical protein